MISTGREPSMEEILASIKKVIAEDKDARAAESAVPQPKHDFDEEEEDDVLELNEELATIPAAPPQAKPLEEMVREMLRPILKQWLDDHLPRLVDEHVKREISRITGRPL